MTAPVTGPILYIGAGPTQVFGVNLDPFYGFGGWKFPAERGQWPAPDESYVRVRASHVLEHIPAGEPRLTVFREAYRVLVPGGIFDIDVPAFPHPAAAGDPTHVSFFTEETFVYFTQPSTSGPSWPVWEIARMSKPNPAVIHCELRKPL